MRCYRAVIYGFACPADIEVDVQFPAIENNVFAGFVPVLALASQVQPDVAELYSYYRFEVLDAGPHPVIAGHEPVIQYAGYQTGRALHQSLDSLRAQAGGVAILANHLLPYNQNYVAI